jgi:uncharacterized Zn-finger protein
MRAHTLLQATHSEDKPFKCKTCDARFTRQNVMLNHMRTTRCAKRIATMSKTDARSNAEVV